MADEHVVMWKGRDGEVVSEGKAVLLVGGRTVTGNVFTASSVEALNPRMREQVLHAVEITGGSAEQLTEYVFVAGAGLESAGFGAVVGAALLAVKRSAISAVAAGTYQTREAPKFPLG